MAFGVAVAVYLRLYDEAKRRKSPSRSEGMLIPASPVRICFRLHGRDADDPLVQSLRVGPNTRYPAALVRCAAPQAHPARQLPSKAFDKEKQSIMTCVAPRAGIVPVSAKAPKSAKAIMHGVG